MTDRPPPEVEAAAKLVRTFLDGQTAAVAPAPKPLSAAERFARRVAVDAPAAMPAWKDPRA